ncbi:MAG TPA: MogA/MoaB family molybdenum cofactor biosynthesis protein [Gaiellales bacterium]|nr:MogA/MoaB family molybdenum cofactor biosynthesis protein [Gaiellales bacterium]
MRAAVLTVSDGVAAGSREDASGQVLADRAAAAGFEVVERRTVPDDHDGIAGALLQLTELADLVLTTGGTGFAPRDVTPEATASVVERPTPGLDEAMREVSRRASPHGLLSRGRSGIRGASLIVNFPGSPRACAECFDAVSPALGHGVELITSRPTEHP